MDSNEVERPAHQQASTDAPLTTEAVPESVTRIDLDSEPPDIPPGETLEIDLLGSGPARTYALMTALPFYTDAEKVLMAADVLTRSVEGIRQAIDEQPPEDVEHWTPLIRRLCWVEELLEHSGFPGHYPLMQVIERGRELLLFHLWDALVHGYPICQGALKTLESGLKWCQDLAEEAGTSIEEYRDGAFTVEYRPLGSEALTVNYPTPLLRGLETAKQLELDMSTLEVGYGCQGDVILALRGRGVESD